MVKSKMVLEVGKKAPAFNLPDKDGVKHSLKDVNSNYTVVYFYPRDNTPGCATEAKTFTTLKAEFSKAGISVIGISGGDEKSKTKFCLKNKIETTLLSDADGAIGTKYGIYGEKKFMGRTYIGFKRMSFLLDKNKKVIKAYEKVKPSEHPQEILEFVEKL